ncbi:putative ubiquitin-conjugating enzyme E2 24 isoform X2 [Tasmannia lanceolata]|uniref:putative ubiquitin-conjugating enzyme E2 24 isoform X2 n=1 Tax=Tasmannia lanceolata TaxID=3420 RepID=UPI004063FD44
MMNILLSDSDCENYSVSSDSEDQDDIESMYGGNAQSIFSSLDESIGKIDDFLAFERGFLHGDIVCSAMDPSGQMGRVVDVDMTVEMETISGEIIKDVNSKKLLKFRSFSTGDDVVHGPWVGRVDEVVDIVTVLFDDGAKCEITTEDPESLSPVCPNLLEDAQYPYYPGQRVKVGLTHVFKSPRWLCGSWKGNQDEGTVCSVEVGSLYVNWVFSVVSGSNFVWPAPPRLQDPKNLTLLSCFSYASWQLGDWCMLPIDDYQNHQMSIKEQAPVNISTQDLNEIDNKLGRRPLRRDPNCEQLFVIVKAKTKVDVLWQDGSRTIGLDSQTLTPVNNVDDHDFWPDQFVLEKGTYDNVHVGSGQRLGIIENVDSKERIVKVKWISSEPKRTADSKRGFNEETVSAYELIDHPDYSYCLGDIVFKLLPHCENLEIKFPVSLTDGENQSHEDPQITKMDMDTLKLWRNDSLGKKHISEGHDGDARGYLSCIGNVIGFKDGEVEVRWASGLTSKVEPHGIVGINRNEDPASTPVLREDNDVSKKVKGAGEDCRKDMWDASGYFLPQATIGFLTSAVTSLFGSLGSTSMKTSSLDSLNKGHNLDVKTSGSKDTSEFGFLYWDPPAIVDDLQIVTQTSSKQQVEQIQENAGISCAEGSKQGQIKQFDTVNDYSDHHFVNGIGKGLTLSQFCSSQVKRGWLKKVQLEWSILEKDLPDTIFVRVYEERIDLMRAAIVGAPGTPYHDGLFFFDIFLPPDYPNEPPLVHYNSGGLRLNPNLYESGRVCLSLLKTWTGTGTELWNPERSTILQVLLSLQALVLNEKPYFNEAGYDKQIGRAEGEKNSLTYNENTFLLSCKSMLYVLHKPPKHFEALVEEHFQCRSHSILLACKAYMDGAPVGCAFGSGKVEGEAQKSSSTGFKIMIAKLIPKLVSGFNERGIDCHQFLEQASGIPEAG